MGVRPGRHVIAGASCTVAVALSACVGDSAGSGDGSTRDFTGVDGPVYESIESLTAEADVVVLVAVGGVRGTEIDDGGNDDDTGIDVTFSSVVVDEVLAGSATTVVAGDVLAVGVSEASSELAEGEEMVLFLEQLTPTEAPGIDTEEVFYVIIGIEANGAFDVQDGAVIARSGHVRGLTEGASQLDGPFTTSLGDLRSFFSER